MKARLGPHYVLLVATLPAAVWAQTGILPGGAGGPDLEVTLEQGARIVEDSVLKAPVLELDGEAGSYAHCKTPGDWERLRNVRIDVKVRLDQLRASSIPIALPGSFMIYISGHGKPWFLFFTDKGRVILSCEEMLLPGVWNDIAVEYRADDICLLYLNGKSVAGMTGRGLLSQGGGELWFGRYDWTDPEDGKRYEQWMKGAIARPKVTLLPDDDWFELNTEGMDNCMIVSWGDQIAVGQGWRKLNRIEHVAPLIAECKRKGVKKVIFRCSSLLIMELYEKRMDENHWYIKAIRAVEGDIHSEVIRQCHEAGIKVYAWSTIFDEGSPTSVLYGGTTPYFWQSKFTIDHPEYLVESRDGSKRQWGVLCYAYPEARKYIVGIFQKLLADRAFDGAYICTRTHSYPAEFADQFGYNQPIAEEFKRRHGVDIRTEDFSKSQWWDLQGEYLTELMRDFRRGLPGKEIIVGIPRSDYIGPPYGNMRLDWRTWVQEKLVDGIVLGTISGGWHYPNTMNLPGYVQSQQDNVGMRELEYDLGQWFGPPCEEAGVGLYLMHSNIYSDKDRDLLKHPGMAGFAIAF